MKGKVLRVRKFKSGYEYRDIEIDNKEYGGKGTTVVKRQAFTPSGDHIGGPDMVKHLITLRGIAPEKRRRESSTCSIGYSKRRKAYYGWSHRAICGFRIGDKIFQTRLGNDKTPFRQHGNKIITTMAQARISAKRFARSVS